MVASKRSSFFRTVLQLGSAAAVALTARASLADHYRVPSGSMEPTVHVGDRIVVSKMSYGIRLPLTESYLIRYATPARGDVVVIQDADCEYDPRDFLPMLAQIDAGAAVVYGTRLSPEAAKLNHEIRDKFYYARRLLPWLTNLLFGTNLTDEATCYKMFRRPVLDSITLHCERFDFCPEVTAKIIKRGYKIYETPIRYAARTAEEGKKIGWRDAFDAAWALLKYRFLD